MRRLYQSFRNGASEVNQKIMSIIYGWCKSSKWEDYISHLQMVQIKEIRRLSQSFTDGGNEINQELYQSFTDSANEVNPEIISVIYK